MTKFQKILNYTGTIIDYIPGVATIVNGSILIYQRAHKVNQVANPVSKGWKSDLKIYVLSKNKVAATASLVPVLGNIAALVTNVHRHLSFRSQSTGEFKPNKYLVDAANANPDRRTHSLELVKLYLERHPQIDPKELEQPLAEAAFNQDLPLFTLLVSHIGKFSATSISNLLSSVMHLPEFSKLVLEALPEGLKKEDQETIVKGAFVDSTLLTIIPRFRDVSEETIRQKLQYLVKNDLTEDQLRMLLDRCGNIPDQELLEILKKATDKNRALIYKLRECSIDLRLDEMVHNFNRTTFASFKTWVEANEKHLTDEQKAQVLKPIHGYSDKVMVEFAKQFAERNGNLSGTAAVKVLENLEATRPNLELHGFFLKTFKNLTAENLQPLYKNISHPAFLALYLQKFPELKNSKTS